MFALSCVPFNSRYQKVLTRQGAGQAATVDARSGLTSLAFWAGGPTIVPGRAVQIAPLNPSLGLPSQAGYSSSSRSERRLLSTTIVTHRFSLSARPRCQSNRFRQPATGHSCVLLSMLGAPDALISSLFLPALTNYHKCMLVDRDSLSTRRVIDRVVHRAIHGSWHDTHPCRRRLKAVSCSHAQHKVVDNDDEWMRE